MSKRRTGLVGLQKRAEAAAAGLRAVGVLRISKRTEASSTIERHQKYITEACKKRGWNIVGWAIDRGVSATKKGPFERPQLGDWLKRPDDFDILVVYRLDRLSRNSQDTRDIMSWCTKQEQPKRLFCVSQEMIDFDPANTSFMAKMAVEIFMAFATAHAQMEVENMGERWSDLKESAREIGYWSGGPAPYGFMTIVGRIAGATYDGKILVRRPETFPILERIIFEFYEENKSVTDIAAALNRDGIISPMGDHRQRNPHVVEAHGGEPYTNSTQWQGQTVRRILLSRILIGEHSSRSGEIFRDRDGVAVKYVEATVTREVYAEICSRIKRATRGKYSDRAVESLIGLLRCIACGGPMKFHYNTATKNGKLYEYEMYRCVSGAKNDGASRCSVGAKGISVQEVHEAVDQEMQRYGNHPLFYSVTVPGSGSYEEIQRAEEAYESLLRAHAKAIDEGGILPKMEEIFQAQLRQLQDRYSFLMKQGVTPPRVELIDSGRTIADEWNGATWVRRKEILRMAGIHVGADLDLRVTEIWDDGGAGERLRLWGEGSDIPSKHAAIIAKFEKGEE